ncbi:MAG: chemotaxis protein CheA [Plesiomonas shigelloides]
MSFELDEDILQDFLIEAGEIIERLSEQLVELEQQPNDKDLLNAIFRGFHTVKGGAGFLSLTSLVDTCHGAENVFDVLRNGKRQIDSALMDVILQALDTVVAQFQQVQNGEEPVPAAPELLEALHQLCEEPTAAPQVVPEPVAAPVAPAADAEALLMAEMNALAQMQAASEPPAVPQTFGIDDISDDEFERLLDALHGEGKGPSASAEVALAPATAAPAAVTTESAPAASSDAISDDEFERLLDDLHGVGKGPAATATRAPATASSDEISDDEFERLLDDLHGAGKGPAVTRLPAASASATPVAPAAPAAVATAPTPAPASVPNVARAEESAPAAPVAAATSKAPASNAVQPETTLRVDTKTLDDIMNMVGELVLVRNRLISLGINSDDEEMSKACANLDVVTADLQGAVMKTRMQPIRKVFGRFPRVVRDLARSLKKEVVLELSGEDTDLDKNLVEALADPLVHLVRNAVDHGIEMPDVRVQAGKPAQGKVRLAASQEGDHILLIIEDDGAGMDPEKLRGIAVNRGMMDADAAARLSDNEAYALIFAPGFSTKKEISDISGRGVGMDVVKTSITKLNGAIHIDSSKGRGTRLEIKVPLTLAILPTLMVGVSNQTFALPLASVNEIFHLDLSKTNCVDGQLTVIVRNKAIPLFYLQDWLAKTRGECQQERPQFGHVVIVQIAHQRIGFVVDTLIGQEEVVIKALDKFLQGTPGMAGATITSDGGIALILDVPGLLKHYTHR